jgi:hypothetical protein
MVQAQYQTMRKDRMNIRFISVEFKNEGAEVR